MKWRFLDTGENNGFCNMALDEALLKVHERELTLPILRVYQWSPPCLSLGRNQDQKTIDMEACKKLNIDIVRRPTGGQAILHFKELTYSVVTSKKYLPLPLAKSYELINRALIAAYGILGLEISLVRVEDRSRNPNCFLSAGLADLTYRGKKLVGSAQIRTKEAVLQHGSLVFLHYPEILFRLFNFVSSEEREKTKKKFLENTTSLCNIRYEPDPAEIKWALVKGFQKTMGIEFVKAGLTEEEILEAEGLVKKYKILDWNETNE